MKCYYEELSVERDANDADIKIAYRKLALRWHPDKNPDSLQQAKERFQLIQQAYEVLSDAHERAWYDNHREQILRGKNSNYEENCLDLFQYFTVSCFKGYNDDAKGFYAVYRQVFAKIAAEDADFMDGEEQLSDIPNFGDSQSSYEEVVGPFYAYWQSYCTKKTYTWLCPYDIQEIRDRRVLREIEKEMKKIVQKAKRERNEEVRNLVSFVRKRDKRAQAYKRQLEERAALNRQKQVQNRQEQIRRRMQEVEEMRHNNSHVLGEGYEEQLKQLEQQYGSDSSAEEEISADEANELEGDEYEYFDDLYCVACNKTFKNERAFANHETSKKHRDNVERMKLEMQEEEEAYRDTEENGLDHDEGQRDVEEDAEGGEFEVVEDVDEIEEGPTRNLAESEEDTQCSSVAQNRKGKKCKKAKANVLRLPNQMPHGEEEDLHNFSLAAKDAASSDTEGWANSIKKSGKKNKTKGRQGKKSTELKVAPEASIEEVIPPTATQAMPAPPASAVESRPATVSAFLENDDNAPTTHICVTCKSIFPSKNKLFAHLKLTNHGVYIPKAKAVPLLDGSKQKKAKGKRK